MHEEVYANWHKFDGVMTPLMVVRYKDGVKTMEIRAEKVAYNPGFPDSLFAPPAEIEIGNYDRPDAFDNDYLCPQGRQSCACRRRPGDARATPSSSTARRKSAGCTTTRFSRDLPDHRQTVLRCFRDSNPSWSSFTATSAGLLWNWPKDWRTDRSLRHLEAVMIVADDKNTFLIAGNGDLIEPDDGLIAIGSGGPYALAAARALLKYTNSRRTRNRRGSHADCRQRSASTRTTASRLKNCSEC